MLRFLERNSIALAMLAMQNYFDSAAPLLGVPQHLITGMHHTDGMPETAARASARPSKSGR